MHLLSALVLAAGTASLAHAQVVGEAFGMAAGTTGGGDAEPAAPADIEELAKWLSDDTPRVILIDREFDFIGSEGKATDSGCEHKTCPMSEGGQGYLGDMNCGGDDKNPLSSLEYDVAGKKALRIGSNKSIVGVGDKGVIRGKGLQVESASNIIIQNIRVTEINPAYVWGGDALTLGNSDKIWIDHCTFSLVGRQMLVAGWEPAGHVTVSNCEFDGHSDWSVTCDGHHYWGMLMIGREDYYTFSGNYLHHLSGRAPHYGTDKDGATNVFHAVNNLFESITGHAFDIEPSTWSVLEGNVFDGVKEPVSSYSTEYGRDNQIWIGSGSECESAFGRACEDNLVTGESGALPEVTSGDAVSRVSEDGEVAPAIAADKVAASIKANAGVGKLSAASVNEPADTAEKDDKPAATAEREEQPVEPVSAAPQPTTLVSVVAAPTASAESASEEGSVPRWGRCGGEGYDGPTTCAEGTCTEVNQWYSQCL